MSSTALYRNARALARDPKAEGIAAAVKWLRFHRCEHLVSLEPDGHLKGYRIQANMPETAVSTWLSQNSGRVNLYAHVNPLLRRPERGKAVKGDVASVRYLAVDIDPPADFDWRDPTAHEAWIRGTVKRLKALEKPPSHINCSGGGIQAFWQLGADAPIADAEARNKYLGEVLGADKGVFSADRLWRIPGTMNVPNAKKAAQGRPILPACIIEWDSGRRYQLEDFLLAPEREAPQHKEERTTPAGLADRSAAFHAEVCRLADLGKNEAEIETELLKDPDGPASKYAGRLREEIRRSLLKRKPKSGNDEPDAKQSQADILIECAKEVELFHTEDDEAYARVEIDGHLENHRVHSRWFSRWLQREFYSRTRKAPNAEALRTGLKQIEANAFFAGARHAVHLRIAEHEGNIYVDLCDDGWRAIEITPDDWHVVQEPPVRFVRSKGMQPLPEPERGGNLLDLRQFVKTKNKDDFTLVVAWLIGVFRADGPYPILALFGEQGSAKSTAAEMLRGMADPSAAPLRTMPRDERDMFITARNSRILCFDNVSAIPEWLSDALCRLSTGGGFSTRQLFTDGEEHIITACRPIMLTAIEDCIERGDLADRALPVELARITDENREGRKDIMDRFFAARPKMLGSLCSALSHGLRHLPGVRLNSLPRMADFAKWAVACELALWRERQFMTAYKLSRDDNNETLIDASSVAAAVREYAKTQYGKVEHTATELLGLLNQLAAPDVKRERGWPKNARALSGELRRAAPALRKAQLDVEFDTVGRGNDKQRVIRLTPPPRPTRE